MTKVIIPQVGDFVQGQQLTEPGFNALNDISDKIEALESVASDDLTETIQALQESVAELTTSLSQRPKIEIVNSTESSISILEDGYDFYTVMAVYTFDTGSASLVTLRPSGTSTAYAPFGSNIHQAISDGTITCNVSGSVSRESVEAHDGLIELSASVGTATPVKWIIHKYKTEY